MIDWTEASLGALCEHIVTVHHAQTREVLKRLAPLLEGEPARRFDTLAAEIEAHMRDEEERLFPAIAALERSDVDAFPLDELGDYEAHHLRTTASLRALHALLADDRDALEVLGELEQDLRTHLHEEHNVLFPRALATLGRAYA